MSTLRLSDGIQRRGRTAEALASENPIVNAREIMIETDTGRTKIGTDGLTRWNSLPYIFPAIPSNDDKVYLLKNGAFVEANPVTHPSVWSPSINTEEIALAVDEDMMPYQLTGINAEVNS